MVRSLFSLFFFALAGCATVSPVMQDTDGTYRIAVGNGEVSSPAVLQQARDKAANMACPTGYSIVSEGDYAEAKYGGHWWRIRCAS